MRTIMYQTQVGINERLNSTHKSPLSAETILKIKVQTNDPAPPRSKESVHTVDSR
jgi:hypothetical protein